MKKDKSKLLITSALTSSLGVFFSKLLGIVYVIPITRLIGETDLVFYTYAYRIYDFFLTLSIAGLPFAISMVVSRYYTLEDYSAVVLVKKVAQYLMLSLVLSLFSV